MFTFSSKALLLFVLGCQICAYSSARNNDCTGSTQNKISFYARLLTDRNLAPSQIVIFDDVVTNNVGAYNRYTGHFIAPYDGTYYFASSFLCEGDGLHVQLMKNGEDIGRGVAIPTHASAGSINAIVNLKHGDVVRIRHATWVGTEKMRGSTYSAFTGYLL